MSEESKQKKKVYMKEYTQKNQSNNVLKNEYRRKQ